MPDNSTINLNNTVKGIIKVVLNSTNVTLTSKVVNEIKEPNGKWPEFMGNVIVYDSKYFFPNLISSILKEMDKNTKFSSSNTAKLVLNLILNTSIRQNILNFR